MGPFLFLFNMHLIFTASHDITTDMLVDRLGERVIRLNNDRPQDHEIQINAKGFQITDKFGRTVNEQTLQTAILRKPAGQPTALSDEALHAFRENSAAHGSLLQLIAYLWPEKLPIHPSKIRDVSKFVQLHAAQPYFTTGQWCFTTHPNRSGLKDDAVLKSLHGLPFSNGGHDTEPTFIYVQPIKPSELADGWPWFLQERIPAQFDITVLYVDGKLFARQLDRRTFDGLDWRKFIGTNLDNNWKFFEIPDDLAIKINAYMRDLGLRFGRLDFLATDESFEEIFFLEVNPNGQWAWMDMKMDNGIFDAVLKFLTVPK